MTREKILWKVQTTTVEVTSSPTNRKICSRALTRSPAITCHFAGLSFVNIVVAFQHRQTRHKPVKEYYVWIGWRNKPIRLLGSLIFVLMASLTNDVPTPPRMKCWILTVIGKAENETTGRWIPKSWLWCWTGPLLVSWWRPVSSKTIDLEFVLIAGAVVFRID